MGAKDIFDNIDKKLLAKFKTFHADNPDVYRQFKQMARKMKTKGYSKYSAVTIIHTIRWERDLESNGKIFKINNDFIALYARLLIYHVPTFEGFFELRTMKPFDRRESSEEKYRKTKNE